jgi:hypothetical protein
LEEHVAPVERADHAIELRHASERDTSGQWKIAPAAMVIARRNTWSSDTGHKDLLQITLDGDKAVSGKENP